MGELIVRSIPFNMLYRFRYNHLPGLPSARAVEVTPLEGARRVVQLAPSCPGAASPLRVEAATGMGEC